MHRGGVCTCGTELATCGASGAHVWGSGRVCTRSLAGQAADGRASEVHARRAAGLCPAPGTYEPAVDVGTGVWSIWWAVDSHTALAPSEAFARERGGCTHGISSPCKGRVWNAWGDNAGRTHCGVQGADISGCWGMRGASSRNGGGNVNGMSAPGVPVPGKRGDVANGARALRKEHSPGGVAEAVPCI